MTKPLKTPPSVTLNAREENVLARLREAKQRIKSQQSGDSLDADGSPPAKANNAQQDKKLPGEE